MVTRRAGESVHHRNIQLGRQFNRFHKRFMRPAGKLFFWCQRIAVAAEGADHQAAAFHRPLECFSLSLIFQKFSRVAVCISGITSRPDLHRFHTSFLDIIEHLFERHLGEQHGEDAQFQEASPLFPNWSNSGTENKIVQYSEIF
jgi:hypothetical protein